MTSFTKCGKCIACTRFNGRNGNGYQPCHRPIIIPPPPRPPEPTSLSVGGLIPKRPIPPDVSRPPIVNLYGDELSDGAAYEDKPSWYLVWLFGLFVGISIGLLIAKSL